MVRELKELTTEPRIANRNSVIVRLTQGEARRAVAAGEHRCRLALERHTRNGVIASDYHPGCSPARWLPHVTGALGECAFAKACGLKWDGSEDFGERPDVGGCEVRTRCAPYRDLSFKSTDSDDRRYVLVQQLTRYEYQIVGWLTAREGRQPKYYHRASTKHGQYDVWFVPPADLYALALLDLPISSPHFGRCAMSA